MAAWNDGYETRTAEAEVKVEGADRCPPPFEVFTMPRTRRDRA
jgi:hypothetical protein